jgi:glycerate dehydrogenase
MNPNPVSTDNADPHPVHARPKIVVLDGYTLNPGDLAWDELSAFGEFVCHERTPAKLLVERAAGAEIVLTNKTPLPASVLEELPNLKFIGVLATGYNVVDVAAATQRGIAVANVPGYGTASVAQHVWALILELSNHVARHASAVSNGKWSACPDFCFTVAPMVELSGKTLGIAGYGAIGQAVADVGRAFGMKIIAWNRSTKPDVENVTLDQLFAESDVLSLHCPLDDSTKGMVNRNSLSRMKQTALLINTGRGPLVVEQDLADSLNRGGIGGAGLDVLGMEPPAGDNPLFKARNCLITPHIAWATRAARQRLVTEVSRNVGAFLRGERRNLVN